MTEQTKETQAEQTPEQEDVPPAPPPEDEEEQEVVSRGFLSRLNPLRLFSKESPTMYIKEGNSLIENHNLALATIAFQKAVSLDPKSMEAHKGLGNVFLRKGGRTNITKAVEHFKTATELAPFEDYLYGLTAKLFEKLGMLKEATLERKKMMIVKTLQTDPTNPIANNNMGILMLQQKKGTEAIEYFNKSITANPVYDIAFRNLSATYFRMATETNEESKKSQYMNQARTYIGKALSISQTVSSLLVNGRILVEEGRFEDALALVEEAELLEPNDKNVYSFKRIVLEGLNRTKDAQQAYESYQALADQTPD